MSYTQKLQLSALGMHVLAAVGLYFYFDPLWFLVFLLGHRIIIGLGLDTGLHRYFCHRSFETSRPVELLLLACAWFCAQGPTLSWVARHRIHHARSDKEGDPHPSSRPWATWLWVETKATHSISVAPSLVKDLVRKREHIFMRNHYFAVYWGVIALSALVFGPKFTLYFFILNGVFGFHAAGIINVICHGWGYRNYETDDRSTNNLWANLVYPGGALHNNHHAKPDCYSFSVRWFELDPSGWLIRRVFSTNPRALRHRRV